MTPRIKPLPFVLLAGALAALLCPVNSYSATYTFQKLDNTADPTFNQLLGINDAGVIGGYFGSGSAQNPNKGYTFAPPYGPTSYTNENFPGSAQTQVVGINNLASPTTVGFFVDGLGNNTGFVKQGSVFIAVIDPSTSLSAPPSVNQLLGVNDKGAAVGFYVDANGNARAYEYLVDTKSFKTITVPGAIGATATGINDLGMISGFYVGADGNTRGFLDNNGTITSYSDPNGAATNTSFFGLNNKGETVGAYQDANGVFHGFTFNPAASYWQTVDDPNSSANPAFDVTGTTINGVNDQGQLVGFYSDGANVNGFLATPTPEPASIGFAGFGLIVFAWTFKRRAARRH